MPHLIELNLEDEQVFRVHQWDKQSLNYGNVTIFSEDCNTNLTFTREALLAILERLSRTTDSFTIDLQEPSND